MRFEPDNLMSTLESFNPHIVGITGVICEYYKVCDILKKVKGFSKNILTVVGGTHDTLIPGDYQKDFIEIIVIGEGELTFKELVETYEKKGDLSCIKGIAINKNVKLIYTEKRPLIKDLNKIPLPNRSLTKKHR